MKIFVVFLLIFFNCAVFKPKPKSELSDRMYVRDLIEILTHGGFYKDSKQMIDAPIVFYTTDSISNPLPNRKLYLVLKSDTLFFQSDSQGKVFLTLTKTILDKRNFFKATDFPEVQFRFYFTGQGERPNKEEPKVLLLRDFQWRFKNDVWLFHHMEDTFLVKNTAKTLVLQKQILANKLGLSPKKWGVVLTRQKPPIHFYEPLLLHNNQLYFLFAYNIVDTTVGPTLMTNIHEWCEYTIADSLNTSDQNVRWIRDGIAELSKIWFAKSLTSQQREELSMQKELKEYLEGYFNYLENLTQKGQTEIHFNLAKWGVATTNKIYSDADRMGYPLSQYFWLQMTQNYGEQIVADFLQRAIQIQDATNEDYIRLLSELTGEDIRSKLSHFETDDILHTLQSETRKLKIRIAE